MKRLYLNSFVMYFQRCTAYTNIMTLQLISFQTLITHKDFILCILMRHVHGFGTAMFPCRCFPVQHNITGKNTLSALRRISMFEQYYDEDSCI